MISIETFFEHVEYNNSFHYGKYLMTLFNHISLAINYLSTISLSELLISIYEFIPQFNRIKLWAVSGKKTQMPVSRNNSRYTKNTTITRSRSSGVLNQSDSDPETQDKKVSRLMRPTISSHNKISNKTLQNRKKHSYSASKFFFISTFVS